MQDGFSVEIVLAIPIGRYTIENELKQVIKAIDENIETIYILGSGKKVDFAKDIAKKVYDENADRIDKPREVYFNRKGARIEGTNAICIEIRRIFRN